MRKPGLCVLFLLCSSCATNALRIEYASDVAAKGKVAEAASRAYLQDVERVRTSANVDIIALDPACLPIEAYVWRSPKLSLVKDPAKPPRGWLCAPSLQSGVTYDTPFRLAPLGAELDPTLVLLDSLATYSDGLTKILDAKGPDPTAELLSALDLARSADKLLAALTLRSTVVPAADDKRLTAVGAFISYLNDLAVERDKVQRIRKFLAGDAVEQDLIKSLRNHLRGWDIGRQSDMDLRFQLATILLQKAQESGLPADKRREFARAYFERAAGATDAAAFEPALDGALAELASADSDLRRIIQAHPKLTPAERARVAQITRERLSKAFESLAAIILSIKGGAA